MDLQTQMRERLSGEHPDLDALVTVATRRGRRARTRRRIGAGLTAAAVVVGVGVGVASTAGGSGAGTTVQPADQPTGQSAGEPTGLAGTHDIVVGSADAPHHVTVYEDLLAHYSAELAQDYPLLTDAAEAGRVQITYRPMALLTAANAGPYSAQALAALYAVDDIAGSDAALAYQQSLFAHQPEVGGPYPSLDHLAQEADQVVPAQDRQQVDTAIEQQTYRSWVDSVTRQDESAGVRAVPDITLDGASFPEQSTWQATGTAVVRAVAAPLAAGASIALPSGATAHVSAPGSTASLTGNVLSDTTDGLLIALPDGTTTADLDYLKAAYGSRTTGFPVSMGDGSGTGRAETKPASPSLAGWTCGDAADEKFDCTAAGGKDVEFVWYPASQYAAWDGGNQDKASYAWISTVHHGTFMVANLSPGTPATVSDATALGESLVWK